MSAPSTKESSMPTDVKKGINKDLKEVIGTNVYHDEIPLDEIFNVLKGRGVVALQEDRTEWSGFIVGREGQIYLDLAPIGSTTKEGTNFYKPFKNAKLTLSWFTMPSGKYELSAYIG